MSKLIFKQSYSQGNQVHEVEIEPTYINLVEKENFEFENLLILTCH